MSFTFLDIKNIFELDESASPTVKSLLYNFISKLALKINRIERLYSLPLLNFTMEDPFIF